MSKKTDTPQEAGAASETAGSSELQQHGKPNVRILYEQTSATFANQVIVNSGRDQIILDFSTGIISDQSTNSHVLPIQTRIAMTPANAVSLIRTLSNVLQQTQRTNQQAQAEQSESEEKAESAAEPALAEA